ncbi:hypothetical protein CIPAW_10G132400 [Carya illinoinensis]|uniref:Uncharacterized protein n=1 Tax=Carya illinoinensis TaxID=32201 RepID=A0A8T1P7E3_CARIL|nr:hypothetical protein CIPAW_10G132400 [Carya illinoinensis]
MENGTVEKGVCSSESVNGSPDIWSCKDSHSLSIDHLVAMVHGIFGRLKCGNGLLVSSFGSLLPGIKEHCLRSDLVLLS